MKPWSLAFRRCTLVPMFVLGAACLTVTTAQAQKIEAGLWEITTGGAGGGDTVGAAMAQMQEQLAKMPLQQRQMVEQMMANQGLGAGSKPNAVRVCITPEQAARAALPNEPGCTHKVSGRDGEVLKMVFQCAGPPASKGEAEYRLAGSKAYSGRMTIDTQHNGKPVRLQMAQQGRWVAADCGLIKPSGKR